PRPNTGRRASPFREDRVRRRHRWSCTDWKHHARTTARALVTIRRQVPFEDGSRGPCAVYRRLDVRASAEATALTRRGSRRLAPERHALARIAPSNLAVMA